MHQLAKQRLEHGGGRSGFYAKQPDLPPLDEQEELS